MMKIFFFFIFRFYAIGFILYFPSNDPYWIWSSSHEHMLLITVIFLWCTLSICIFLFVQSILIWHILKRNSSDNNNAISNEQFIPYTSVRISDNEDDDDNNNIQMG